MSNTEQSNNKRVLKNAAMLTFRMVIVTLVGLYTSRVVFAQLGDINYGIYGVVGGILGFMGFLTSSMAGASSRFITYEIGQGNFKRVNEVFNSSFYIHCSIAGIVIVVGETFGVWFLYNVLSIPPDRLNAAFWVFQFSIISSAVSITQIPYTAVIMAHERMGVYAYMELIGTGLKLLVVYLLSISKFDKLITYSFLLLVVSVLMAMSYRVYCIKKFDHCKLGRLKDKNTVKSMLSFSGMDLYGNVAVTLNNQGLTYAINIFFGVVYNAAVSLANTINGMILALTTNMAIAFKPQIVKQYAQGNYREMLSVMCNSIKFTSLAMALIAVPCGMEAEYVMKLWLGEVPTHSVEFLRIIIVLGFFPVINNVCNSAIHANGNIKKLTFINGTVFLMMPLIIFLLFYLGCNVIWGYGVEIIGFVIIIGLALWIIKNLIPEIRVATIVTIIVKCLVVISISIIPIYLLQGRMAMGLPRTVIITLSYGILLSTFAWFIILTRENHIMIQSKIKVIIKKSLNGLHK